jgi:hypothetical protein
MIFTFSKVRYEVRVSLPVYVTASSHICVCPRWRTRFKKPYARIPKGAVTSYMFLVGYCQERSFVPSGWPGFISPLSL